MPLIVNLFIILSKGEALIERINLGKFVQSVFETNNIDSNYSRQCLQLTLIYDYTVVGTRY